MPSLLLRNQIMKTRLKIGVRNCSTQHIASSQIGSVEFHRLLEISDEEWQGILRFGRYCSFPLVVCARLKQANIGSRQKTCRFWVSKTGQSVVMPLGPNLISYLRTLQEGNTPNSPLFPRCFHLSPKALVAEFNRLLVEARVNSKVRLRFSSLRFDLRWRHKKSR